jgi:hypothetical protein
LHIGPFFTKTPYLFGKENEVVWEVVKASRDYFVRDFVRTEQAVYLAELLVSKNLDWDSIEIPRVYDYTDQLRRAYPEYFSRREQD